MFLGIFDFFKSIFGGHIDINSSKDLLPNQPNVDFTNCSENVQEIGNTLNSLGETFGCRNPLIETKRTRREREEVENAEMRRNISEISTNLSDIANILSGITASRTKRP